MFEIGKQELQGEVRNLNTASLVPLEPHGVINTGIYGIYYPVFFPDIMRYVGV